MMTLNTNHAEKINRLLQKLSQSPDDKSSHVCLDVFLEKLAQNQQEEDESTLLDLPVFQEWIIHAVAYWEGCPNPPAEPIANFTLKLLTLLSKDEKKFTTLNQHNVYTRIVQSFRLHLNLNYSPKLVHYMKLLNTVLTHKSGVQWAFSSNQWNYIFPSSVCPQDELASIARQCVAKYIENMMIYNELTCIELVAKIIELLDKNSLNARTESNDFFTIMEDGIYQNLKPTLLLLCYTLKYLLQSPNLERTLGIVSVFTKRFNLHTSLSQFIVIAENKDFIFDLSKILFLLYLFELYTKVKESVHPPEVKAVQRNMMEVLKMNIQKNNTDKLVQFCHFGFYFWKRMSKRIPEINTNIDLDFQHELLSLQMFPFFLVTYKFSHILKLDTLCSDEIRCLFVEKLKKPLSEHAIRLCFMWRDASKDQDEAFVSVKNALTYFMGSKKNYERNQAIIIFQGIVYCLMDVCFVIRNQPDTVQIYMNEGEFLYTLLEALAVFIEEFSITWRESVESICVVSIANEFLGFCSWTPQIVVKALKLMNISIAKYMAPNLALLVDRTSDSNMALISPLLYAKLHDSAWEVRDSALEVLCTISNLANTKFTSFQKVVLETELPQLVLKMSTHDGESFVRATALKCLCEMVKVDEFWDELSKKEKVAQQIMGIMQNETEGIVRKEATTVMCSIYQHHRLLVEQLPAVYEVMGSASLDLHWEVKIESLKFWDAVIKSHLQHQGMIDGAFPAVTFSKENRKIVTLTEREIAKRLQKVLVQLSSIGCLGALVTCIQDECDIEVSKVAVDITQTFLKLLRKYNVTASTSAGSSTPVSPLAMGNCSPAPSFSSGVSVSSNSSPRTMPDFSEDIVGQIVSAQDINLLKDVYAPSDCSSSGISVNYRKTVSPQEFLVFTQKDFDAFISEKKKWLKGFDELGSLLDDMLKNYEINVNEVNSMDCY